MYLLEKAQEKGFIPEEKINIVCQLQTWLEDHHDLYVEPTCYTAREWGIRIYRLDSTDLGGAPIVYDAEPSYSTRIEALTRAVQIALEDYL